MTNIKKKRNSPTRKQTPTEAVWKHSKTKKGPSKTQFLKALWIQNQKENSQALVQKQ